MTRNGDESSGRSWDRVDDQTNLGSRRVQHVGEKMTWKTADEDKVGKKWNQ